jgi:uncharacterized protein (TIGR02421 family)
VSLHFAEDAPEVTLVDTLSANALATADRIRIRRDARFTDRDAAQLLNHEAYIHVATSLNGRIQTDLPILGAGHPRTTRTQEGLAVFAEIISGTIELDRLRRLADRVFAIQMAIEGADFLEVYGYFLERTGNPDQSFENARRVFRGGGDYRRGALHEGRRLSLRAVAGEHCDPYDFLCGTIRLLAPAILWKAGSCGHSSTV